MNRITNISILLIVALVAYTSIGNVSSRSSSRTYHKGFGYRSIRRKGHFTVHRGSPKYLYNRYLRHRYYKQNKVVGPTADPLQFERKFCQNGGIDGNIGKRDGNYSHPKYCEKYIICKNFEHQHSQKQQVAVKTCDHGLFFNSKTNECDWPSNVECFLYQGRTCYGTKGNSFGTVRVTQTGYLKAMKVFHVSGSVTCKFYKPTYKSYWGCNTKEQAFKYLVNTWVTTTKNIDAIVFPTYKTHYDPYGNYQLEGYNQRSPYLKWKQGPHKPTKVQRGQELRVWYGEDLFDIHEEDNKGKHCVDVYALFSYFRPFNCINSH